MVLIPNDDYEPLKTNCFTAEFESKSMTEETLKFLTLMVTEVELPSLEFSKLRPEIARRHFYIHFQDMKNYDVLNMIKELALAEDLIIKINIFDTSGNQVYKPITLTDCIFNEYNLGPLSQNDGCGRCIKVQINAITKTEDYERKPLPLN